MSTAVPADSFVAERLDVGVGATERAGVGHLLDDDRAAFHRDEEVISLADIEQSSCLGRDHDPSQIVDLSGDSTVHSITPPEKSRLHRPVPCSQPDREKP